MNRREYFVHVIAGYRGTPYLWGGDDQLGVDCSGLINEGAPLVGLLGAKEDRTAEGWYQHSKPLQPGEQALPGDLLFWKNADGKVIHVEMFFAWVDGAPKSIGASGGNSSTTSIARAQEQDAFVKDHEPRPGYEVRRIFPL